MRGFSFCLQAAVATATLILCTSAQPVPAPLPLVPTPAPTGAPGPLATSGQSPLPFIILHGLTESCNQSLYTASVAVLNAALPGVVGFCMEIGDGRKDSLTLPMMTQVQMVCDQVRQDPRLAGGFNLTGYSQGGLIARGYVELCDGPPVNHFISLGAPQAGVAALPYCTPDPEFNALTFPCIFLNDIGGELTYSPPIQQHFAPTNYAVLPGFYDLYLNQSTYLPVVNNERPDQRNETYKQRFTSLRNLTLVLFAEDTILIPVQTAWFGFYARDNPFLVLPYNATALYREDWFGLQTLNRQGKVAFVNAPGVHLNVTFGLMRDVIIPALRVPGAPLLPLPPEVATPPSSQTIGTSTTGP